MLKTLFAFSRQHLVFNKGLALYERAEETSIYPVFFYTMDIGIFFVLKLKKVT
jgi:hypothetical protein